ncbi:16S rRNA processing protein RimM [hydrothermal vent metagenome]|uniref:16S rRNA processing protein RimM n=1 Tax=hydrothermal vent metagenome TaxID=652676 RepID=A0A3B0XCL3_9ZZZZ
MVEPDSTTEADGSRRVTLGKISGVSGVKGWIKVHSFTDPREKIVEYGRWQIKHQGQWREVELNGGRRQGKTIVAKLEGLDDRNEAMLYTGDEIAIFRNQLEQLNSDEYYWYQLEGLSVVSTEGVALGRVDYLLETGANDVLVVKGGDRERLIPFTLGHTVIEVDLQEKRIKVDWDPAF